MTPGAKPRRWRVGDLARATGLTVRTLHHYESLGLLPPPGRTEGRQRRYDARDVQRLYRVCALRELGLSLAEIGRTLGGGRGALAAVLKAHRARVDEELVRLGALRTLLEHAAAHAARDLDPEAILATLEAMTRVHRRGEAHRREGRTDGAGAEARWRALGRALRACLDRREPPTAPAVRALAAAARAQLAAFAAGDEATLAALAHLRRHAPPSDLAGWDAPLVRYLDQAMAALAPEEAPHAASRTDRAKRRPRPSGARLRGAR